MFRPPSKYRPVAYAIAFINKTVFPPVVEMIDIYSSPSVTMNLARYYAFVVCEIDRPTLEDAIACVRNELHINPAYRDWCPALLNNHGADIEGGENVHAAFVLPAVELEPGQLASIRVLYRDGNGSMGLWGIPYDMRADVNQSPKDINPKYRHAWIWLGSPGWWGRWSIEATGQIKAYLAKLHTPDNPHEWCKVAESMR